MHKQLQAQRRARGMSLVEIMVAVVIIGVLSAIALPAYQNYIIRGKLTEAFSALGAVQANAEQFWLDGRTYANFNQVPANTANFTFSLSNASATTYTITATGTGTVSGFVFTIDQSGARATTGVPSGWTANASCWVDKKDGTCSQ